MSTLHRWRPTTISSCLVVVFGTFFHFTAASCVDCGPFGTCSLDHSNCEDDGSCLSACQCHNHWTGHDCSVPFALCPSVGLCLNGGECQEIPGEDEEESFEYKCACPRHNNIVNYLDAWCGFRPSYMDVCERNVASSDYAYCVHGGKCRAMVETGNPHPLCHCPKGFEGRHCQFVKGTAPSEELVYVQGLLSGGASSQKNRAAIVTLVATGMLVWVGLVWLRRWRRRRHLDHKVSLPEVEFTCSESMGGASSDAENDHEEDQEELDELTDQPERPRNKPPLRHFGSSARNGPRPEYYYKRKGCFSERLVV